MFKVTFISMLIFFATALNIFTVYLSWQRRKAKGGYLFAFAMMALVCWTLFAALDYSAVSIPLKVFFAQLEVPFYSMAQVLVAMGVVTPRKMDSGHFDYGVFEVRHSATALNFRRDDLSIRFFLLTASGVNRLTGETP